MRRWGIAVGLFVLWVLLAPRQPWSGASAAHSASARALATRGTFDLAADPLDAPVSLREGRRFALVGPAGSLVLVPAVLLARAGGSPRLVQLGESATSALLAALMCLLLFGLLQKTPGAATVGVLLLALATPVFVYARLADATVLAALLLLVAVAASRRATARAALVCGCACGALVLVDHGYAVPAVLVAAFAAGRDRAPRRAALAAVPLLLGLVVTLVFRQSIGVRDEGGGDLVEGLLGLLLSTGKGLFLFAPPLVLWAWAAPWWWRNHRADAAATLIVVAATLLSTARLASWHGDPAWGPRRIIPLLPLLIEPIALWLAAAWPTFRWPRRAGVVALAVVGLWVQILGTAFSPDQWQRTMSTVRNLTGAPAWFTNPASEIHFVPQFSPLSGHAWLLGHYLGGNKNLSDDAPFRLLIPSLPKLDAEYGKLQLDLWWLPPRMVR